MAVFAILLFAVLFISIAIVVRMFRREPNGRSDGDSASPSPIDFSELTQCTETTQRTISASEHPIEIQIKNSASGDSPIKKIRIGTLTMKVTTDSFYHDEEKDVVKELETKRIRNRPVQGPLPLKADETVTAQDRAS